MEAGSQVCSQALGHLGQVPFPSGTQVFWHNDRCLRALLAWTLEDAGARQAGRSFSRWGRHGATPPPRPPGFFPVLGLVPCSLSLSCGGAVSRVVLPGPA